MSRATITAISSLLGELSDSFDFVSRTVQNGPTIRKQSNVLNRIRIYHNRVVNMYYSFIR